uniref:Queuosine 5'-phosphate N-glycosylase/hydrolase n=1 Tax=Trichuris muris TaxID=70415 RepID=A0A5S6QMU1_TRIMR
MDDFLASDYLSANGIMDPRASARFVLESAKHVRFNKDRLDYVADLVFDGIEDGASELTYSYCILHVYNEVKLPLVQSLDRWFFATSISFSFWSDYMPGYPRYITKGADGKLYKGSSAIMVRINELLKCGIEFTASSLREMPFSVFEFLMMDRRGVVPPMIRERWEVIQSVATTLDERFGGHFYNCIKKANFDAGKLLSRLLEDFPRFRDIAEYEGRKVGFLMRAQCLILGVDALFKENNSKVPFRFDKNQLCISSSHRTVQMMRYYELLIDSPEIEERMRNGELFTYGEPDDVEMRAVSNYCVEEIKNEINRRFKMLGQDRRASSVDVDAIIVKDRRERVSGLQRGQILYPKDYLLSVLSTGSHSSPYAQIGSGWEREGKDGKRHLQQLLVAVESSDFSLPLERNRLKLRIQHGSRTALALRKRLDDMELEEKIRLRLQEFSIDLDAVVISSNEQHFSLQERSVTDASQSSTSAENPTSEGSMTSSLGWMVSNESTHYQLNKEASVIEQRLDLCPAESTSILPHEVPLNMDLAQPSPRRMLFDLTKDGGYLISAILGQKAEELVPVFSGEPTEYSAWEEAIAPIRFCTLRQPIMKFSAIKKSLKGEAVEIVKWIGMDLPNPVESFVDALKREYGRAEIVIRAQEARLDKLVPPSEEYPPLRNFVIAVRSCLATMKAHRCNVEDNPQFTRQLGRKLNWTLVKRWRQKEKCKTSKHLLEFLDTEADILQKAYHFKPDIVLKRLTVAMGKPKERALISVETSRVVARGNQVSQVRYRHHELLHWQRRKKVEDGDRDQVEMGYVRIDAALHLELLKVFVRCPKKTVLTIDSGCSRTFVEENLVNDRGPKVETSQVLLQGIHAAENMETAKVDFDIAGLERE